MKERLPLLWQGDRCVFWFIEVWVNLSYYAGWDTHGKSDEKGMRHMENHHHSTWSWLHSDFGGWNFTQNLWRILCFICFFPGWVSWFVPVPFLQPDRLQGPWKRLPLWRQPSSCADTSSLACVIPSTLLSSCSAVSNTWPYYDACIPLPSELLSPPEYVAFAWVNYIKHWAGFFPELNLIVD